MLDVLSRPLIWQLSLDPETLLAEYASYRQAAGYALDNKVQAWGAHAFLQRYPDLASWRNAPLAEQVGLPPSLKYFANYLFLKHYLQPTMAYLLTARPKLAQAGQRYLYAQLYAQFYQLGQRLGYADHVLRATLHFLFYLMAYAGKGADVLTEADLQTFEQAMRAYQPPPAHSFCPRTYSQHLYRVRILLFQAGILPQEPLRFRPQPARSREILWADIPQPISQVVWRYLDQLGAIRALDTVKNHEGGLRRFFAWLAQTQPEVQHLRQITRPHIEAFKLWLQNAPCVTGNLYHRQTIKTNLSVLRCFFQAIQEWDWPEAPERLLIFARDLPIPDEPLPRFLDDPQAAALLQAARVCDDLFTRVCVETLLRTGLRKGEFVRLQLDSVVQIGDTFWLRVPLGLCPRSLTFVTWQIGLS